MACSRVWLWFSTLGIDSSSASVYGIGTLPNSDVRRRVLDDAAGVHDGDVVGTTGDDAEVVGDEDHPHVPITLLLGEQVEDLRLHGDVEGRGRLVGEQELGTAGQRDGDDHTLTHAARELAAGTRRTVVPARGCGRPTAARIAVSLASPGPCRA